MSIAIEGARVEQLPSILVAATCGDDGVRVPPVEEDGDKFLEVELGARCGITGIRRVVAQQVVALGVGGTLARVLAETGALRG